MRGFKRSRLLIGLLLSLSLVATACGGGDDDASDDTGTQTDDTSGDDMSGDDMAEGGVVPIAGSSTVGPISQLVAEDFGGEATVEITGTGGGFKDRFCTGETAINDASRQIKDSEIELCAENGVTNILELRIGIDGMTVMTSAENDLAVEGGAIGSCLNFNEIYGLVGPESGDVATWADANPIIEELGGHLNGEPFPDVELATAGPGTESGTYDSFYELAIESIAEERGQEDKFRPDWSGNNDDNVIIQGITGNQYSFGWVGYAYYTEVADQITAFEIAGEDGNCVAPTDETIASGEYPLSRPLFIYVNLDKLDEDYGPTLQSFVDYYMSDDGRALVSEAGYVQLTDEEWSNTVAAWEAQTPNVGA